MPKIDRATEAEIIRAFRRHTGMTQQRLAELLGATSDVVGAYERDGAPGWVRLSLFGLAVRQVGMRAEAAAALVGIVPPAPLLDRVPASRGDAAQAAPPGSKPRRRGNPDRGD